MLPTWVEFTPEEEAIFDEVDRIMAYRRRLDRLRPAQQRFIVALLDADALRADATERRDHLRDALLDAASTAETEDGWPSWVRELADMLHVPIDW